MPKSSAKILCIFILIFSFSVFALYAGFFMRHRTYRVEEIVSPLKIKLSGAKDFSVTNYQTFDSYYSKNNEDLSKKLNISEDEAFILGCFGKYWAENILQNCVVEPAENDLVYNNYSYRVRFENSPYALKNWKPLNQDAFEKQLQMIRRGKFVIVNADNDKIYPVSKENVEKLKNYVVLRKSQAKNINPYSFKQRSVNRVYHDGIIAAKYNSVYSDGNIKIIVSDLTSKILPDNRCSSDICKELLKNINSAKSSIDIAIYGYSSIPEIETALKNSKRRGVRIRIVYDIDSKGENIYPDTLKFMKEFPDSVNDKKSYESGKIMHNKFYIFDKSVVITGSANLSGTDMSGFNTNAIITIKNPAVAEIYSKEFEQMFSGKFHNEKSKIFHPQTEGIEIFFSPKEHGITQGLLPILRNAEKYIYVPAFIITHKEFINELIKAKNRGIDVRVILDSLNANGMHSKHRELKKAGIPVKAENYAGKMHSKTVIVDDKYLIIGSMNFSNSGENKNDENMVILKNPKAAEFYREFFIYQWNRIPEKWLNYIPRAESFDSVGSCSDGLDNNYDGKTDKEDVGCVKRSYLNENS